ncbi:Na+/H+ antiporter NhaA [Altererythrobacter indicus]|uniref:Na(+)/H(+) antiporter NhaA n=1 Tax=Altericroceibacterium indicum TaxID=374177 RepID=A0A845AG86_9SPHN|nr:Na+/H+ antiporter NhaA [Altericroceibacterium indicum]MXP26148.1 Na+/H+ antiporter NhaA [Altericroceibacterium indicum]
MLKEFLDDESAGGIFLMIAAALALIVANSPLAGDYVGWLDTKLAVSFGGFAIDKELILWINDGLMALFFFVVGLEVKREVLTGQLSSLQQASLPLFAAVGGMAIPALIFLGLNFGTPENLNGWAIPAATDIAFALGILALLGDRVPVALKALLLAIAVIDDIGAILIIAIFYSHGFDAAMFGGAVAVFAVMALMSRMGMARNWPYVVLGLILWVFVLKSGIHATLAGVAAALTVPITARGQKPLERMEHALHPWVTFLVVPVFAFANAGVSLAGIELSSFVAPLPLGIALGLIVGKQLGIFGFAWAAVKMGWASLPPSTSWKQVHGLSLIAGIGFTMSLFIGNLAFSDPEQLSMVKVGVLSGSILSAVGGFLLLRRQTVKLPPVKGDSKQSEATA